VSSTDYFRHLLKMYLFVRYQCIRGCNSYALYTRSLTHTISKLTDHVNIRGKDGADRQDTRPLLMLSAMDAARVTTGQSELT